MFLLPCRLCVAALSVNDFCDGREALYGVFDGDRNVEVPYLLQCTMSDILAEELRRTKNEEEYMVNTFIVMQRCDSEPLRPSVLVLLRALAFGLENQAPRNPRAP